MKVGAMKIGIIGVGAVGSAIALAMSIKGPACEIVLIDKDAKRAKGVATDLRYGLPLLSAATIYDGDYEHIRDAQLVIITAGINERDGGATDRSDPLGRMRLLDINTRIFEDIIPKLMSTAPNAVILIATNPPEPLVDIARQLAGHDAVLSTSTFLDTLRFKFHVAKTFGVKPTSVDAVVVGEHGNSSVFLWSSARVGGVPISELLNKRQIDSVDFYKHVEDEVRFANISIIEGIGASQYGIGIVARRVAEIILGDERVVIPVGSYNKQYKTIVSLPSVVGKQGVEEVFLPEMSAEELRALEMGVDKMLTVTQGYRV